MSAKYFSEQFNPRFNDTDALGHINNTMVPVWFEGARDPVFRWFSPELDTTDWRLILAKIDVSFIDQMYYGKPMEVRTYIGRIGGSSFDVYQELWQNNKCCASGTAVMVHYNYQQQKSVKIPEEVLIQMNQYLHNLKSD
ncbi:acyl-CoA thioesterase [Thalassotalea piscium]|uniref:Acyl-CoA thioester hydrolase n=1 Tax=Thalassotalea piscium TaxID=1230533 RepID=A0A7X0NIZ9_9GAMM|nr:thioesterase family protein [Thalassotalea piscium]MBB6544329.1 acyl-CoA thioester hydrolase [Thalassotalea piscium]